MTRGAILIDVSRADEDPLDSHLLRALDHPVMVCHGPPHQTLCPLLAGKGCHLIESAHGIIFQLDLDRPQHRAILSSYVAAVAPGVPIRAVVKPGQADKYADLLSAVQVWEHPPTIGELDGFAASVEAADG